MQCRDFTIGDAFVGYHEDTIPSIVMQVCNDLADENSPSQDEAEDPWEVTVRLPTVFGNFGGKSDSSVVSRLSQVFGRG